MYKLLLCVRYLQTRYLAFICIVSVMLGVATLIVVNAVMSGFSTKLKDRLHGVISDVVITTERMDGFIKYDKNGQPILGDENGRPIPDEEKSRLRFDAQGNPLPRKPVWWQSSEMIAAIQSNYALWEKIEAVTPTIEVFAILQFNMHGQVQTKPVKVIGIEPGGRAAVGGFSDYLVRQNGSPKPSFDLTPEALKQHDLNKRLNDPDAFLPRKVQPAPPVPEPGAIPPPDMNAMTAGMPQPQLHGFIPGYSIAHFRFRNEHGQVVEEEVLKPGDDVTITTVGGGELKPVWGTFLVTDYIKTEMSEYDAGLVYVPLEHLQSIRGMEGRCTALQIKLKDYNADKAFVSAELKKLFHGPDMGVATWEENQGPLLTAIDVERGILNLLLFMIVGVAGFSILAIFTMIVSEKYRDIGIMKALGASNHGVMSIFVGYGLLLGAVGCMLGTMLGLWITRNINEIEAFLSRVTGKQVFPRDVYYFKEIPTNIDPLSVVLVNIGAVTIATLFSLLPAWRAARLHPVRALRFE